MDYPISQGPRSNFEIGGGGGGAPILTQYWRGTKHLFLLILYNFKNIGGGGGHVPPGPPTPRSLYLLCTVHVQFAFMCVGPINLSHSTVLPCLSFFKNMSMSSWIILQL